MISNIICRLSNSICHPANKLKKMSLNISFYMNNCNARCDGIMNIHVAHLHLNRSSVLCGNVSDLKIIGR